MSKRMRVDAITGGPAGRPAIPLLVMEGICTEERQRAGLKPATDNENCLTCLVLSSCDMRQRTAGELKEYSNEKR